MTKKTEPSESYLSQLEHDLVVARERFEIWKRSLYNITATARLGEPAFENARKGCLEANHEIVKTEAEIGRVKKVLDAR